MAKTITSQIPINAPSHTSTPEIKVPLPRGYPECQHRRHGSPWCLCDYPIARALVGRGLGPVVLPAVLVVAAPEPVPGSPLGLASWGPAMQTTPQSSSASSRARRGVFASCFATQGYTPATRPLHAHFPHSLSPSLPAGKPVIVHAPGRHSRASLNSRAPARARTAGRPSFPRSRLFPIPSAALCPIWKPRDSNLPRLDELVT